MNLGMVLQIVNGEIHYNAVIAPRKRKRDARRRPVTVRNNYSNDYFENFTKSASSPLNAFAFSPTRTIFTEFNLSFPAILFTTS